MTKKELIEQLSDTPDDTVICNCGLGGEYYEVSSIEFISKAKYAETANDEEMEGDIIVL